MKKINISKQYNLMGNEYSFGQKKFYNRRKDESLEIILNYTPKLKNKIILDAGCGNGHNIIMYEKMGGKAVYGLDISEVMIREAKRTVKNPNYIKIGSIEKSGFKSSFFDIIISRFTLHYLKNFDQVYKEFHRILKINGILILAAAHPLRDFIIKRNKNYYKQEKIQVSVYDNNIPLVFPSHTFKQYFSPTFFKFFNLVEFSEQQKMKLRANKVKVPSFFVIKATKKLNK